jgi:CheY-like chemotaxis protein/anti-sigma regulatory factor (Ser/Thr protein kinase)
MSTGPDAIPRPKALIVEDSLTQAILLRQRLARSGFEVRMAKHGAEALEQIERELPSVILTDLDMPEMDGLELVKRLRAQGTAVPVILMTAKGSEEIAVQALQAGASGYVPKRNLDRDLARTMEQVLARSRVSNHRQQSGHFLDGFGCRYVLPNDPALISPLVRRLQRSLSQRKAFDETDLVRIGMALREALMNAIEHGNLEISSHLREDDEDAYHRLIKSRRNEDPYRQRSLYVGVQESRLGVTYTIRDEGPGFDPTKCGDPTDPANLEKTSGRGLLLMRAFMDEVTFNASGNEITMSKSNEPKPADS